MNLTDDRDEPVSVSLAMERIAPGHYEMREAFRYFEIQLSIYDGRFLGRLLERLVPPS